SIILGEMVAILLENKYGLPVERKLGLGGTKIAFDALQADSIDVYPDYTGTGYVMILKMEGEKSPQKIHQIVSHEFKKRWGIIWSKPIGFNNTYALAVRENEERFKSIFSISQLKGKLNDIKYGAPHEFMERNDGHQRFSQAYNLQFNPQNIISLEAGLTYAAIKDKTIDMIIAYSTDGRIKAHKLRLLKDDLSFFPPYHAAFIAKQKTLEKYPQLQKVFELLAGKISDAQMTQMNDKVDRLKIPAYTVAKNFLIKTSLIDGTVKSAQESSTFLEFIFTKKAYLKKILIEHLVLSLGALFFALIVSIPLGIFLTRHQSLAKYVFPIINTIQTIPSLALLGFLIPLMGIGTAPAIVALFLYSLLPLVRNTYTGILSIDQNYIEASKGVGLTNFQILYKVEIPLALPIIITGIRTAAVIVIGTATLAALIGAGGFGDPIFRGISTVNSQLILLGAIPAALLAIIIDKLIGLSEHHLVSKGLQLQNQRN
ncbi:MAG: ABC transporter permease subunit, partial [Halobacteriovoraceae bacterium]|nr:ABC transporter permease subunit [Halobacteriovoraceae bacterium]